MKITDDVLRVLASLEIKDREVRIVEQLDRKLYIKTDETLQALGGKWNRKAKAHLFDGDAQARVDLAITIGEVTTDQDLGFFPTPEPLAQRLVELAGVKQGCFVLEPSAGTGVIVEAAQATGASVVAIERDAERRKHLAFRRLQIHDWTIAVRIVADCDDFLDYGTDARFHRVVMNPPFCKVGKGDHLDHVVHAYSLLRKEGVLVSVLPSSIEFRQDKRHTAFRSWVLERGTIESLPLNSFKESGTSVNTCVIRIEA